MVYFPAMHRLECLCNCVCPLARDGRRLPFSVAATRACCLKEAVGGTRPMRYFSTFGGGVATDEVIEAALGRRP